MILTPFLPNTVWCFPCLNPCWPTHSLSKNTIYSLFFFFSYSVWKQILNFRFFSRQQTNTFSLTIKINKSLVPATKTCHVKLPKHVSRHFKSLTYNALNKLHISTYIPGIINHLSAPPISPTSQCCPGFGYFRCLYWRQVIQLSQNEVRFSNSNMYCHNGPKKKKRKKRKDSAMLHS